MCVGVVSCEELNVSCELRSCAFEKKSARVTARVKRVYNVDRVLVLV